MSDNQRIALGEALVIPIIWVIFTDKEWPVWRYLVHMSFLACVIYVFSVVLLNWGDRSRERE
jgi:hypothetical protein